MSIVQPHLRGLANAAEIEDNAHVRGKFRCERKFRFVNAATGEKARAGYVGPRFQFVENGGRHSRIFESQAPSLRKWNGPGNTAYRDLLGPSRPLHMISAVLEHTRHPALTRSFQFEVGLRGHRTPDILPECDHTRFERAKLEGDARASLGVFEDQDQLGRASLQIPRFRLFGAYAERRIQPLRLLAGIRQKIVIPNGRAAM